MIDAPSRRRVLQGLALNREPGWNFPGNFLQLSFDDVGPDSASVSVEPGPHIEEADGQSHLAVLCVLADVAMAAATRTLIGLAGRTATVSMALQFTGAPRKGRMEASSRLDGFVHAPKARQALTRADIRAGGALVATGTAGFMSWGAADGMAPLPLRKRGIDTLPEPLAPAELRPQEAAVLARADEALRPRRAAGSFIGRFWGLEPRRTTTGATCSFENAMHVGNRVGHTQGGLTFALAACTSLAALDDSWAMVGISAWYTAPGTGPRLKVRSTAKHRGSLTAVVETLVSDVEGRAVLRAVSSHMRRG